MMILIIPRKYKENTRQCFTDRYNQYIPEKRLPFPVLLWETINRSASNSDGIRNFNHELLKPDTKKGVAESELTLN